MRIEEDISKNVEESAILQDDFKTYANLQYESRAKLMAFMAALNGNAYLDPGRKSDGINLFNEKENGKRAVIKDEYNNAVQVINNSKSLDELKELNGMKRTGY